MRILVVAALASVASVQAAGVSGQGSWETTLQARDIDHDGTVDAYYDTDQDITWLADANFAMSSGYDTNSPPYAPGAMDWATASHWAQTLDLHGVEGWRLPTAFLPSGCTQTSFSCANAPSEMSRLFEHALGGANNTGPFTGIGLDTMYWTGTLFSYQDFGGPQRTLGFSFVDGSGGDTDELSLPLYAWAVHDGDIAAAVPEPQTYALLLAGIGLVVAATRRKRR
ncbi:MAG TPA: PEP-CTERM sorting domain-containing protein [Albitalea sp.]|nr:PEP-CTERM sorting domain-containing protein [Albitalea sp.]